MDEPIGREQLLLFLLPLFPAVVHRFAQETERDDDYPD